jgi:hypothetical protein
VTDRQVYTEKKVGYKLGYTKKEKKVGYTKKSSSGMSGSSMGDSTSVTAAELWMCHSFLQAEHWSERAR